MNITLFTKNSLRHNYLINSLSKICNNLYVISENFSFEERVKKEILQSTIKKNYFEKVNDAEKKVFNFTLSPGNNIKKLELNYDELSNLNLDKITDYLDSDYFIIFGSSYIKNDLIDLLVKKKAVNIHMGISPYYRGSDCNFWALYDDNSDLVGATIHLISKGLDSGPILYHVVSDIKEEIYTYSMSCVKASIDSLVLKLKNKNLNLENTIVQNKSYQIRYTKKNDFSEDAISKFLDKNINLKKKVDLNRLINPFILKKL